MDDFTKYEELRRRGWNAPAVYGAARTDGLDAITLVRLIRQVFGLSLVEAKEVKVRAEGLAPSLEAYQEQLAAVLERALQSTPNGNGLEKAAACKEMNEG